MPAYVTGLADDRREVLVTTLMDARPDVRPTMPSPNIWPLLSAVAVTILFVGSIFTPCAVVWAAIPVAIGMTLWFWPRKDETMRNREIEVNP